MRYDIKCEECGAIEERQMSPAQTDDLEPCNNCGSACVRLYIGSAPATIFKGKDWFCKSGQYGDINRKKEITMDDVKRHEHTGAVPMF